MLQVFNSINNLLASTEKFLLFVFSLALSAIMIAQVILRYFFGSPIFWAEEVSIQLLIFITIFGVSYLSSTQQHIHISFVLDRMQGRMRNALQNFLALFFLLVMAVLCYYSWEWVLRPDVQLEKSGTTGLPKWYVYVSFPIALSFLCWHQLVHLLNSFFLAQDGD